MGSHEESVGPPVMRKAGPEATRWGSQLQRNKITPSQGLGGHWGGLGRALLMLLPLLLLLLLQQLLLGKDKRE